MKTFELLSHLRALDVILWVDGTQLRCNAPDGVLTSELRAALAEHKTEIITFLREATDTVQVAPQSIPPVSRNGVLPLSFSQQRLWALDQLEPNNPAYNIPTAVRLTGPLNVVALEKSINEVIRRHETLRTTFATANGNVAQIIAPRLTLPLQVMDLCHLPEAERKARALHLAAEEAKVPFDLARLPLLRAKLLKMGVEEHVLLLTLHHIVSDDWSMGVLVQELVTLYQAYSAGKSSPLSPLPIQYADFAVWQREWLQGEVLETQLAYWKQRLQGLSTRPELPTDRSRPPLQTYRGGREFLLLSERLARALKALSQQEERTLFMTLLAVFKVLLHQYTGQTDIVVGSPVASRTRPEIEGLVGFFINTVVLRTDLSGDPTVRELLGRVREMASGAYAHQDLPFERLVQELQPERDLSSTPLFQVFFNMLNFGSLEVELPGLQVEPFLDVIVGAPAIGAKFDMTLYVIEQRDGIQLDISYNADLFEKNTIVCFLTHLQTLLEDVVRDPDQPISSLPHLNKMDWSHLLEPERRVRPGNGFVQFVKEETEQSLTARFAKQVRGAPDKTAVETPSGSLTYEALDSQANRVAQAILAQCGDGEGRIALLFEQGVSLIVGILGTLKAGKTYVPLVAAYPRERTSYMLQDSQATALLTNDLNLALAKELAGDAFLLINLDRLDSGVADDVVDLPTISPDALAYIIYTSGSTGHPKGVVQTHRNVLHFIMNYTNGLHICADDRLSLIPACSFSAAVMDTFAALLNGATLCPFDVLQDGVGRMAEWLMQEAITIYHSVPTVFRHFAGTLTPNLTFPKLRLIDFGGEPVSKMDVELYKRHFSPDCILVNGLGATELNVIRQYYIDQQTEIIGGNIPAGYAVEDTEILLLDEEGREVGFNREGEIVIRSRYLSPGYWNKPDQTRAAFQPDPQGGRERLYYTGDLGRMRLDGCLEHLGRKDFQVKVRGVRIEPAEIEVALLKLSSVQEAVVLAREDESEGSAAAAGRGKCLVAYVVANDGREPTAGELRHALQETLPTYMVPTAFVTLDALPLTPNGKVNRRALPAPDSARPALETAYVSPRSEVERTIAAIWEEILHVEQVGVNDNFFDLGGHSLLVVQMHGRLVQEFQREFPMTEMFRYTTVGALAQYLSRMQEQADIVQTTKERAAARRASLHQRVRGR